MRILFLTPYVPSDRAGGEKFTKLLLEDLSKNNQIDLVYYKYFFDKEYVCPNENVRVLKVCKNSTMVKLWNCLKHPMLHPTFSIRFSYRLLCFLKKQWKQNDYDLLYLDHSQMLLYGKYFPKAKKILMSHDVMAERFGHKGGAIAKFVRLSEGRLMHMPNLNIFTFSQKDVDIVNATYGLQAYFANFYMDENIVNAVTQKVENRFVFFGKWKRPDNFDGLKWFFDNVYPCRPKEEGYAIIGIGLPDDFKAYVESLPNVEYLGFVDNPYEIIANSKAVVSPIFSGAGVKVKVVESLACGTPVIGNELAFEGISAEFSKFMLLAKSKDEYIEKMDSLVIESAERKEFKEMFLKNYRSRSIPVYLKELKN